MIKESREECVQNTRNMYRSLFTVIKKQLPFGETNAKAKEGEVES